MTQTETLNNLTEKLLEAGKSWFGEEAVRKVLAEGCKWCKGTGVYYVQSGYDEVEAEECECQTI